MAKHNKRFLWPLSLLVLVLLIASISSVSASTVWDGQGVGSGSTGAGSNYTGFSLPQAGVGDIVGYRFSIYDGDGTKLGKSIDINFRSYFSAYRVAARGKQSHVDLYAAYKINPAVKLAVFGIESAGNGYLFEESWSDSVIASHDANPAAFMDNWLTQSKAYEIAQRCEAFSYGSSTSYIICEPLFASTLVNEHYVMTMAEQAVYQSTQCGWVGNTGGEIAGTYAYNVMRLTSAVWGRYMYATGSYPALGTYGVPASAIKNDSSGSPSVLLGSGVCWNNAEDILKYQVGMAVYTDVIPTYTLTIDPNGGYYNGSTSVTTQEVLAGASITINDASAPGHTFTGWTVSGSGSLSGTTYTQGAGDCTLTAQWSVNNQILTLDPNGGSLSAGSQFQLTYGTSNYYDISWNIPVRPGCVFNGWYTSPTDGVQVYTAGGLCVNEGTYWKDNRSLSLEDYTLYAHWTQNTYTVKYDGNGTSEGTTAASSHIFGEEKNLTPNGFKKAGYVFTGWNTQPDGSGTAYSDQQSVKDLTTVANGEVVLYAQWVRDNSLYGKLRFIQYRYLDTLEENSKWRGDSLNYILSQELEEDLSVFDNCQQVWFFPAEADAEKGYAGYEDVHEWCLEKTKGTDTNEEFLEIFGGNRVK